jgi:predicted ATPase
MRPNTITISGYRSIRRLFLPIEPLSVFVGENGVGKSNLYKALSFLRDAATGRITRTIAEEGGLDSVLWAGIRKKGESARLLLKVTFENLRYSIELGFPQITDGKPAEAAFLREPMIKEECIEISRGTRNVAVMERTGSFVSIRNDSSARKGYENAVLPSETVLANFSDINECPEIELVKRAMEAWRFYHDFRTDRASPIRQPCFAVTTPSLSADASDLAAVLATSSSFARMP